MKHLTVQDIIDINKQHKEGTVINLSNLEFVVKDAENGKTLEAVAARLLRGILTSHPFLDGNKRTGFDSMALFLKLNGKEIKPRGVNDEDIARFLYLIAQDKVSIKEIEKWITSLIQ